jgi:hypothetical protein
MAKIYQQQPATPEARRASANLIVEANDAIGVSDFKNPEGDSKREVEVFTGMLALLDEKVRALHVSHLVTGVSVSSRVERETDTGGKARTRRMQKIGSPSCLKIMMEDVGVYDATTIDLARRAPNDLQVATAILDPFALKRDFPKGVSSVNVGPPLMVAAQRVLTGEDYPILEPGTVLRFPGVISAQHVVGNKVENRRPIMSPDRWGIPIVKFVCEVPDSAIELPGVTVSATRREFANAA